VKVQERDPGPKEQLEVVETPKKKSPIAKIVIPIVALAAAYFGYQHLAWSRGHEATDNAQVAGDVIQIVPQVTGTISNINVADNQIVKKGDLLVTLDSSKYEAAVQQAQANLDSALADAEAAGIAVDLTRASATASQTQSSGTLEQAGAGVGQAQSAIASANASLRASSTAEQMARLEISTAKSQVENAQQNVKQAKSMVTSAQTILAGSKSAVRSAEANVRSANARADLAQKDSDRAKKLFEQGAISRQQMDAAAVAATAASAAADSAKEQLSSAQSSVAQRQAELEGAISKYRSAETSVAEAKLGIGIANQKYQAAQANRQVTAAQIQAARQELIAAQGEQTKARGQIQETATAPIQVKLKQAAKQQALARVEQAKAALKNAQLDLERTKIYAPSNGRLSKRTAEVGNLAQAGASLFSLVRSDSIYVLANFKETQVAKLKPGESVSVEIDAFPGTEFHGVVDSQSAATGSTFALLPPDNATGNFVKVVQRLPVKIRFDEPAERLKSLQIGMSANVTVKVG
jgi:membrane fusion protein (multidrug efflux system)